MFVNEARRFQDEVTVYRNEEIPTSSFNDRQESILVTNATLNYQLNVTYVTYYSLAKINRQISSFYSNLNRAL